jgi:hypothetical protein
MARRGALGALAVVFVVLSPAVAAAQDAQYWTLQYGPVAELLGGIVVGSTRDLSATYYNPGALALAKDPSLLASVESFEATSIRATGSQVFDGFDDTSLQPSPTLFAFALPRSWTGSHTIAVSGLTRQDFDLRLDNWEVTSSGRAGAESMFEQNLNENWFGLSWGHRAGENFGVGLTTYVAYRGQRTRKELSGQAAFSASEGGAALLVEDTDYSNYRLLWKGGISTQRETWDLGLTFTTPSVRLFGSGDASYVRSAVGADLGGGPSVDVSVRHEQDLDSHYRSPWSVAVGGAYRRGRSTFHATAEWFDDVAPFDVLDTSGFASDPAAASLVKRLRQKANSVVNFGVGYERKRSERFRLYGAFTTDFTFNDKDDSGASSLSTWDIYHVTAGTSLVVGDVTLTMGAAYAFGSDTRTVATVVVPPNDRPVLTPSPLDVKYQRFRVLVGFDFGR